MKPKKLKKKITLGTKKTKPTKISLKDFYENRVKNKSSFLEFLKMKEKKEGENITDKTFLYPTLTDPNFNKKIASKKEFNDTKYDDTIFNAEERGTEICTEKEFELSPTQMFVRNFLSFQTPYNNLLLFHGLGTGKTCSAISVCEEMRKFTKQLGISKRIIIVASPNVQDNFKLQLFDPRNLKYINGLWTMRACTGNTFIKEINPMYMKGFSKDRIIKQIKRIINTSYLFMGYTEFSNYITKILKRHKVAKKAIQKEFSNRLIVIDEVHNIRSTTDNKKKKIAKNLLQLVKYTENLKFLLLSATPMFNSYKEIIWLLNLMNLNDKRFPISINDVFTADGSFQIDGEGNEIGKDLLIRKAAGYISFVRGENPYTFPYRIYPKSFSPENSITNYKYPKKQINDHTILTDIQFLDLFVCHIGEYQKGAYEQVLKNTKEKFPSFAKMEMGLGYTVLEPPLQVLNMSYPSTVFDGNKDSKIKLYGTQGLERLMTFEKSLKKNYSYKNDTINNYGRIFSYNNIEKYSGKIHSICKQILKSKGIVLIYSQYLNGGCIPLALTLEEMGFNRYGRNSLFKKKPTKSINPLTMEKRKKGDPRATYIMITGDKSLSPNNDHEINACTNEDNINGEKIKVVIISKAGSEGIDLKNIRQVHILDPWYNLNRIEQIIGRAVRFCSHKKLPFKERNTEIYLYGTYLDDEKESADLYVYRLAEKKAIQISTVSRILKENAVDCLLNRGQTHLSEEIMKQRIHINLSSGKTIDFNIGDKKHTAICDYMDKCSYSCNPNDIGEIDRNTYNEEFIIMNLEKITQRIRNLMKEHYIYKKNDLIMGINRTKKYPLEQIYVALNQLINDKNEYITDMLDRIGYLVNIDDYYMFQPIELEDKNITRYERVHPLDYKRRKLQIILPKKIQKIKQKGINIKLIIEEMKNRHEAVFSPKKYNNKDWYVFCSLTIPRLERHISIDLLHKYVLHHIVDSEFLHKRELIEYIYFTEKLTDFEKQIKVYLDSFIIEKDNKRAILLMSQNQPSILIFDKTKLRDILPTEFERLKVVLGKHEIPLEKINDIIGFMTVFPLKDPTYTIFKVKDLKRKSSKGARCDQISSKSKILSILNDIIDGNTKVISEQEYTLKNTIQQIPRGKRETKIVTSQLCCELELILRYYDDIEENGKKWFFTATDTKLWGIEKKVKN